MRVLRFLRRPFSICDEQSLPFVHREHAPRVSLRDVVRPRRRQCRVAIERGQARLKRGNRSGKALDVLKIELDDVGSTISIVPPELPFAPLLGIVQLRWGEPSREVVGDWAPGQIVWHALPLRREDDGKKHDLSRRQPFSRTPLTSSPRSALKASSVKPVFGRKPPGGVTGHLHMNRILKPPFSISGAISQGRERCQFPFLLPFLLHEKSTLVPVGSAGERLGGARKVPYGAARASGASRLALASGFRLLRSFGIDRLEAPAHAAGSGSVGPDA